MDCFSLAILSRLPSSQIGTNWPKCVDALKTPINCLHFLFQLWLKMSSHWSCSCAVCMKVQAVWWTPWKTSHQALVNMMTSTPSTGYATFLAIVWDTDTSWKDDKKAVLRNWRVHTTRGRDGSVSCWSVVLQVCWTTFHTDWIRSWIQHFTLNRSSRR